MSLRSVPVRARGPLVFAAMMLAACRRESATAKPDPVASASLSASPVVRAKTPHPEPITPVGALHGDGLEPRADGDVYAVPSGTRLTTDGRVSLVAITIDRSTAVFLRAPKPEPGDGGAAAGTDDSDAASEPWRGFPPAANGSELWVLKEGARPTRRSVVGCEPGMSPFGRSDLSPDGRTFYFTVTSGGPGTYLIATDVETGTSKLELPSLTLITMLKLGPDAGQLLVSDHRYYPAPDYGSHDVVELLTPAGKVVRELGEATDPKTEVEATRLRWPSVK